MNSAQLATVVTKVANWNPQRDGTDSFTYVDLSSVDQHLKAVTEPSTIAAADAPSRARQLIAAGDVLVSTVRPNLNAVAFVPPALNGATASTGFCVLRPRPECLDGRYLFHWVRSPEFVGEMVSLATGASYPAVSDKIVKGSRIPLPPVEEQRRIAAVLDAADVVRAKRRQAIAKLDILSQSIFIDMFGDPVTNDLGWPVATIGDALESATYGTSKKAGAEGEFAVLRMGNIGVGGQLDFTDLKYVDLTGPELDKHLVVSGDVLFNRTNSAELVGKTAVYREREPMAYAGYLVRLRPGSELDAEYLGTFMNLRSTKRTLRAMCKSIVGMANINAKEVQSIRMAFPPIELQRSFASKVQAVLNRGSEMSSQAGALDMLFASLQQRAFRGEL